MKFIKKNIFYSLAICSLLLSCDKEESKTKDIIVSGKILNKVNDYIFIGSYANLDTIKLAQDGAFRDTLQLKPGKYLFRNGNRNTWNMYLNEGDHISFTVDIENFNNPFNYKGKGAEINNYLNKKQIQRYKLRSKSSKSYDLEEASFIKIQQEIKKANDSLLDSSKGLSGEIKQIERKNTYYDYLQNVSNYQPIHRYRIKNQEYTVSEGFLSEINALDYEDFEAYSNSNSYKNLLNLHYNKQVKELVEKDAISPYLAYVNVVGKISNDSLRNTMLYQKAKNDITFTDDFKEYYKAFTSFSTNPSNNSKIETIYNGLYKLSKGQPSPKFSNYEDVNGKKVSLDDFKGKYVYIDVWATWCAPCKKEIPFLKKIEEEYREKNIVFVSMSVDELKAKDKWKKTVEKENLSGVQIYATKSWDSQFVKDYIIKGIPRFILIDPQGKIISQKAPNPSQEELRVLLKSLNV